MQEKYIEQKLVTVVKSMGGLAPKFVSPGIDGMPDRIVLLPMRKMAFVECKATGKKMRPLQLKRKQQLEALGFLVYCLDDVEQIGGILGEIQAT
ncbi:VRR-NUC domain-containing protein [Enterococcus faecalis]|uniref:VRR-NUC domain-containing protein n=1 Tax=Listeria monocytogenes TaxID=1639 RepID=UPI0008745871|nr:VRR-NUC domain-containing protein [Listeria monocytogenes]OFE84526.1 nuclease [Listeria monocytogenes]